MEHCGVILTLSQSMQSPQSGHPNWEVLLHRREKPHRGVAKMLLIDLAQVAEGLPGYGLVGVLPTKPSGSHIPRLDVGESAAPPDIYNHLAPEGPMVFKLSEGVLWAVIDTNVVHAGKQQSGKTGGLQAVVVRPSVFGGHL